MDLAKERDFTIDIGWGQPRSYLQVTTATPGFRPFSDTPIAYNTDFFNGTLAVYVVNDLTSPNSTANNDVTINVFVEACEDFEVFEPTASKISQYSYFPEAFVPQMADNQPDADLTTDESAPMMMRPEDKMAATLDEDHTPLVFHADPVVSFRQCLKRYNFHAAFIDTNTDIYKVWTLTNQDFPFYRGYDPTGFFETLSGSSYNFCKNTLLNYLTPAYVCVRGGLRVKYYTRLPTDRKEYHAVTRLSDTANPGTSFQLVAFNSESGFADQMLDLVDTWNGSVAQSISLNNVIEAELPYYANYRFRPARQIRLTDPGAVALDVNKSYHKYQYTKANENTWTLSFVSIAEDFNLNFFIGVPVMYFYEDPPPQAPP
jgi:hypothetical protein